MDTQEKSAPEPGRTRERRGSCSYRPLWGAAGLALGSGNAIVNVRHVLPNLVFAQLGDGFPLRDRPLRHGYAVLHKEVCDRLLRSEYSNEVIPSHGRNLAC
jgi:hypothetical protein